MKRRQREAVIAALDERMLERDSWCGETHLQKAGYFLQVLLGVPTDFRFFLYKYGPFSRDLRQELAAMRADGFLRLVHNPAPYGPTLETTASARQQLVKRWPKTLRRYKRHLDFVADQLGSLGVGDLERLATALWATREMPKATPAERAALIHDVKPHVSTDAALAALERVKQMERAAAVLTAS